jgi:hypothetical protein
MSVENSEWATVRFQDKKNGQLLVGDFGLPVQYDVYATAKGVKYAFNLAISDQHIDLAEVNRYEPLVVQQ